MRDVAANGTSVTFHPYPITPFQGDYLYHVDQADAAKAQFSERPRLTLPARAARA